MERHGEEHYGPRYLEGFTPDLADAIRSGKCRDEREIDRLEALDLLDCEGELTKRGERVQWLLAEVPNVQFPIRRCTRCGELYNQRLMAWAEGDLESLRAPCIDCALRRVEEHQGAHAAQN